MASLDITYFLSIETWTEYGYTDTNTDPKKLLPTILAVQEDYIEPVLGTTLYRKLISDIKGTGLTGLYKTLMDDYILITMISYCDWKATFHTTDQITNKTTGKNNDEHIRANDLGANNNLRDELIKTAVTRKNKIKTFLCDNWDNIPELSQAVDADMLSQTIRPHIKVENDYMGSIGII